MTVPWHEVVQSTINDFSRRGLGALRTSNVAQRGADDGPTTAPPVPPHSNASSSRSHRGQMPQSSARHLTKTVEAFLGAHDNAACAPIHIESDDEVEATIERRETELSGLPFTQYAFTFTRKLDAPTKLFDARRSSGTTPRQSTSLSESKTEDRLARGLVDVPNAHQRWRGRRNLDSESVRDQMKKSFKTPSGPYKPCNTLNGRSAFLQQRTSHARAPVNASSSNVLPKNDIHANDHGTPNKRRKIQTVSEYRVPAESDSEDELALETGRERGKYPEQPQELHVNHSSPQGNGVFSDQSAQRRKDEKDQILESSPGLSKQPHTSPYLTYLATKTADGNGHEQNSTTVRTPESPDILQSIGPHHSPKSLALDSAPYPEMKSTDLKNLIIGQSTNKSKFRKRRKELEKEPPPAKEVFLLTEIVHGDLLDTSGFAIGIDSSKDEVFVARQNPLLDDEPVSRLRGIDAIFKVTIGDGSNDSALVNFHFRRYAKKKEEMMWLRFESYQKAMDFSLRLQASQSLKVCVKTGEWMEMAFSKAKSETTIRTEMPSMTTQAPQSSFRKPEPTSAKPLLRAATTASRTHGRLVDRLDPPADGETNVGTSGARRHLRESAPSPQEPGSRHATPAEDTTQSEDTVSHAVGEQSGSKPKLDKIPPPTPGHDTDTHADNEQLSPKSEQGKSLPNIRTSPSETLGTPWATDLIYPQPGRRAAVVPFEDLERLDDDEFLNDNLISFFMRYLETHIEKSNPELYKRMHFFNTYFYAALSKTKGKKGIRHDAVSRWTKNINLFSRDFVIVPVNEDYHWYLAIICNLPYLLKERAEKSDRSEEMHPSDQRSKEVGQVIDLSAEDTAGMLADLSHSDDEKTGVSETKKEHGRRKTARRGRPKYDVTKPVIITLDSLGTPRPVTCSHLKQYVVSEARDKRNMDIDATELKGMTAKEIPTQNNYSDCGLYLCAYLEQFVADPHNFVRRILQREENAQQWPRKIRSRDLRSRLRQLILEMHRRQENEPSQMEEPAIGSILIDIEKSPRSPLPSPSVPQKPFTRQDIQEAHQRFDGITRSRSSWSERKYNESSPDPGLEGMKSRRAVPEVAEASEDFDDEKRDHDPLCGRMPGTPTDQMRVTKPEQYSDAEPSRRDVQSRASPQARDIHPVPKPNWVLDMAPGHQLAHPARPNSEHHSDNEQGLNNADELDSRWRSRSSSQTSELTDFLAGPSSARSFLPGILDYATRGSRSKSPRTVIGGDQDAGAAAVQEIRTGGAERGWKRHRLSPEPESVAEKEAPVGREFDYPWKRK
ncbi:hypothetical protein AYL99_03894 [Fonsecaea erecta]|uniref:Ubiquitin-like protease family profile domain-containing protein n=1 Tax=Fonsecaea erecta TaxID=1367422 RepID=A0A178ZQF3_9EURO|nr:hypothetical protein AYL99_03894 [Fonsecaea erecta]OAP61691.1 hypothetical protein AYL99_03894 [Fonsecaea erecta]